MSHIETTAASASRSSRAASTPTRFDRRRLVTGVDSQLPIAIPASTVASITVKAYVVGRKRTMSMRNQMISSANETKPDTAKVRSTSRRTSADVGAIACGRLRDRRGICDRCRRRRRLPGAGNQQRADGDEQIDDGGDAERPRDAQLRNHPDAGDERPRHGAGGVAGVEERDLPAENRAARERGLDDEGQRRAHQGRGHDEHGKRQDESHDADDDWPVVEDAVRADIKQFDAGQGQRRRERGDGDAGLGRGKDDERPPHAIGQPSGDHAAEREAGHEGGEDGARGMDGDAEDERQEPHPEHLVDEGADAGQEEEQEERRQACAGGPIRFR